MRRDGGARPHGPYAERRTCPRPLRRGVVTRRRRPRPAPREAAYRRAVYLRAEVPARHRQLRRHCPNLGEAPVTTAIVARLDNAGDVLLAGPAVRAVAAACDRVVMWCGRRGVPAAVLLPGVDDVVAFDAPWVGDDAPLVDGRNIDDVVGRLRRVRADLAVVLTSYHQSPLPAALLLRLAGVPWIGAISPDHPGSLLDVRHPDLGDVHESERALALVQAMGFALPAGDRGDLRVRRPLPPAPPAARGAVIVHPGASVPARTLAPRRWREIVAELGGRGARVVVTGSAEEQPLTAYVAEGHPAALDLGGAGTLAHLAAAMGVARAVVVGNTGPAHLASAVRAPTVSVFPPTVPSARWRPYGERVVLLGEQGAPCAGCRARRCPVPGQPCL